MPGLALLIAYFLFVSSGQRLPASIVLLQSFPVAGSNEPLQVVEVKPVEQTEGVVAQINEEGSIHLIHQLANLLLAFNNPGLASRSSVNLNNWWQRQLLKMQEDLSWTRHVHVAELKVLLQEKGLPVSGDKAELIARLKKHAAEEMPSLEDDLDDDLDDELDDFEDLGFENLDDLEDFGIEDEDQPFLVVGEGEEVSNTASVVSEDIVNDADMSAKIPEKDLNDLSVAQLKDMLKENGLKISGMKAELLARLEEHRAEEAVSTSVLPESIKTIDDAIMSPKAQEKDPEEFGLEYPDAPADTHAFVASGGTLDDADRSPKTKKKDLGDLRVALLKEMLKQKGLKVSGKKAELIARLEEHMEEESPASGEPVDAAEFIPKSH